MHRGVSPPAKPKSCISISLTCCSDSSDIALHLGEVVFVDNNFQRRRCA